MASFKSSDDTYYCSPCKRQEKECFATHWCKNCRENICLECFKIHKKMKFLCSHDLISIIDATSENLFHFPTDIFCIHHARVPAAYFCLQEKQAYCVKCLLTMKKMPHDVIKIEDIAKNLNSSMQNKDLCILNQLLDMTKASIEFEHQSKKQFSETSTKILLSAKQIAERAKEHIDDLQLDELQSIGDIQTEPTLFQGLYSCKEFEKQIQKLQHGLFSNSGAQVAIEQPTMLTETESLKNDKGPQNTKKACGKEVIWQEKVPRLITVIKKNEINDPILYDGVYLHDGQLVVSDWDRNRLLLFDANFTLQAEYDVESRPWDVCISNDRSIIYVVQDSGLLVGYDIKEELTQTLGFKAPYDITGVSVSQGTFIIGYEESITLYNMDGKEISRMFTEGNDKCICVSNDGSLFYHGDGDYVVCRNVSDLSEVFRFSHPKLCYPRGIACDRHGNILVAGWFSGNIILINKDGTQGRVLLEKLHGICDPSGICCHPQRDEFVIMSWGIDNINAIEVYDME